MTIEKTNKIVVCKYFTRQWQTKKKAYSEQELHMQCKLYCKTFYWDKLCDLPLGPGSPFSPLIEAARLAIK